MSMQVNRRIGTPGAPTVLAEGQLSYNDIDPTEPLGFDSLYIGSTDTTPGDTIKMLVGATRQVELAGAQTITGAKTIAIANFHLTGGAANNILTTDGVGGLSWSAAPTGGLLTVSVDAIPTLSGDGTAGSPLSVLRLATPRDITIQTAAAAANGSITTISITPASFSGAADGIMTGFAITRLDDGTY
jgi:hypothetical protein